MFQEYPKALYKGGDESAPWVICDDADEEAAYRADGFAVVGEEAHQVSHRDALTAEAEALGIKVDKRWGDDRLASEVAKAKG